jgi:hypothetical protein
MGIVFEFCRNGTGLYQNIMGNGRIVNTVGTLHPVTG